MKRKKESFIWRTLRRFFSKGEAYIKFRKEAHKFRPIAAKDDHGRIIYYRDFKYIKPIGALIIAGKAMYRIITQPETNAQGRFINGEHELIKLKRR